MFSTEFPNSLNFFLPMEERCQIVLAGCGGTGSWLAPAIARTARWLADQGKEVIVTFVDPDRVEEKNVFRQNFCLAEIGHFKAETLASRYGASWGIEIGAVTEKFGNQCLSYHSFPALVCGCLDRASARRSIRQAVEGHGNKYYWLDSGNSKNSGQVLFGGPGEEIKDPFLITGKCTWLPLPAKQHPELMRKEAPSDSPLDPPIEKNIDGGKPESHLSCAEMALQDAQGMAINQRMAAEMADYLIRLFVTKDLRKYATYIDQESGTCSSKYITVEAVNKWMK